MTIRTGFLTGAIALVADSVPLSAADQTKTGAGNDRAIGVAADSPLVQSAVQFLSRQLNRIQDPALRTQTQDATANRNTCVTSRAGVNQDVKALLLQKLLDQGLVDPADAASITGGLGAGVFPPLRDEATDCPKLPQAFSSAPGSSFGGHHSYPGGLVVHETFNSISSMSYAAGYRRVYGASRSDGMPVIAAEDNSTDALSSDVFISQDVMVAAPLWHDWAKPIVFQWNADGSEFTELNFGGNGVTDSYGSSGDSRTGGHHILGIAEAMKRGFAPDFIITQASAHSAPTSGNEFKVVNWIRAAAILAQVNPVAQGYLYLDSGNRLRLPPLRQLGSVDLVNGSLAHTNTLAEYSLHNLSDADFNLTGPAVSEIQVVLNAIAPQFDSGSV